MSGKITSFNITFQGVRYVVDVVTKNKDTRIFIEYADIDDDVEENMLLKLTDYLIKEGFLKYENN